MSGYVKVGHTKKPHGIKGELKIVVEDPFLEDLLEASVVFLEIGAGMVPCFPEGFRDAGSLLIKFDGINDREAAAPMVGRPVYLREEDLHHGEEIENDLQFDQLTGYTLYDLQLGRIGPIDSIEEYPQQEMAVISYQGREILIPLHPDLIDHIDDEQKEIHCNLPEGLLEL